MLTLPPPPPIVTATVPPPPLVRAGPAYIPSVRHLAEATIRCGNEEVVPSRREMPVPVPANAAPGAPDLLVTLSFRIDETGRPMSIGNPVGGAATPDLVPAFSAWRFPAQTRAACTATFQYARTPIDAVQTSVLMRMIALDRSRPFGWPQEALERVRQRAGAPGGNCMTLRHPPIRLRAYPALESIRTQPGELAYSFLWFDIDPQGQPINVRLADSSGNTELDRASVTAVENGRYAAEARTGCYQFYYREAGDRLPLPEERRSPGPDNPKACTFDDAGSASASQPPYPPQFRRRSIEGWVRVSYDVAPWGAIGNVRVLAAEPAAAYGEHVAQFVRSRRAATPGEGASGCTLRVTFVMPDDRMSGEQPGHEMR